MRVIKLYQLKESRIGYNPEKPKYEPAKPKYNIEKPEYYHLVRSDMYKGGSALLVNYPIDKPNSKREARWFYTDEIHVEWVKTFLFEGV
jgi:hypothetical protein